MNNETRVGARALPFRGRSMLRSARPVACRTAVLVLACLFALPGRAQECVGPGAWATPGPAGVLPSTQGQVLDRVAARSVVLLGERHDAAEHHRWQLHMLSALHARRGDIAIGFEMFPRRTQPVLDRWVAGELTEAQFLQQSDWADVWGYDASLYLPLFHFARMHRMPMVALNVERALVREVGRKGALAIPDAMREGVGRPEDPPPEYVQELHAIFRAHAVAKESATTNDPAFQRFVESQALWDRAMAEGIRNAQRRHPGRQVVGIMGRGHTVAGAVPHQLRALGVSDTMVLLPWERGADCSRLRVGVADAVFGVEPQRAMKPEEQRPRLGVTLGSGEGGGVRIDQVSAGSVAAQAGLEAGDIVLTIAGRIAATTADVVSAVGRQAPGTWLPLRVRRDGSEFDVVARFPPSSP